MEYCGHAERTDDMGRIGKKLSIGKIIFWALAVLWLLTTIFPLYFTIISSLKEDNEIWESMVRFPETWRFDNYIKANSVAGIIRATFNSLFLSVCSIGLMMACVIPASYVIARKKIRGSSVLSMYFLAALMIPIHGALIPIVQMSNLVGGQNSMLYMIIIYSGLNFSMSSFLMSGYIQGIDSQIDEAASIDGCSLRRIVWNIIVPISKPGIATSCIVAFLSTYNELPLASVLLTKKEYQTISVALLAFKGDYQVNLSWIFASIVISMLPIVIFYILCQENVEKGMIAGAVKG